MSDTLMSSASVAPAIAEIWLVAALCVILLVDVFAGERRRGLTSTLTLLALALGAALTVQYGQVAHRVVLFDGMYVADQLGFVLKLAGFLSVAVALLYSRAYLENRSMP
ncbi:MAG: NADH:ubiquinone oxidoreductase subunit N, partial [Steroidobacteraceae bacterium]